MKVLKRCLVDPALHEFKVEARGRVLNALVKVRERLLRIAHEARVLGEIILDPTTTNEPRHYEA